MASESSSSSHSWWNNLPKRREKTSGGGGGGPKPKIKFGNQTRRGRLFPVPPKARRTVIVKTAYFKVDRWTAKRVKAWINYCSQQKAEHEPVKESLPREEDSNTQHPVEGNIIEHQEIAKEPAAQGSKSQPLAMPGYMLREPFFFNSQRDGIAPDQASKTILDNIGTSVSHHTLLLSPGRANMDLKAYTRDQMKVLEEALGHKLTWVANINRDTGADKQHVHVTIAGRIKDFQEKPRDIQREHAERGFDSKDIDLSRVAAEDKIEHRHGLTVTKFHSELELREFDEYCRGDGDGDYSNFIPKEEYQKLWGWIGSKEQRGETVHGVPPLKEHLRDEPANEEAGAKPKDGGKTKDGTVRQDSVDSSIPQIDYAKIRNADKIERDGSAVSKYSPLIEINSEIENRSEIAQTIKTLAAWRKSAKREAKQGKQREKSGNESDRTNKDKSDQKIRVGELELSPNSKRSDLDKAWKTLKPHRNEIEKLNRWRDEKNLMGEKWHGEPPMLQRAEKSVDDWARELTGGKTMSVQAVKLNAALRRYEQIEQWRQQQAQRKDTANFKGDVFLTRDALAVMREHGNYYIYCLEQWDREVETKLGHQRIEKVHIKEEHPRLQEGLKKVFKTREQKAQEKINEIKSQLRHNDFLAKETAEKVQEIVNRARLNSDTQSSQPKQAPGADMVTQGNSWKRVLDHIDAVDTTHSVKASEKNKDNSANENQTSHDEQQPESDKPKNQIQRHFPQNSEQSREDPAKQQRPRDHKGRLM